ncbi:hypothetical protein OROGR_017195 [Orobanche gracilis]
MRISKSESLGSRSSGSSLERGFEWKVAVYRVIMCMIKFLDNTTTVRATVMIRGQTCIVLQQLTNGTIIMKQQIHMMNCLGVNTKSTDEKPSGLSTKELAKINRRVAEALQPGDAASQICFEKLGRVERYAKIPATTESCGSMLIDSDIQRDYLYDEVYGRYYKSSGDLCDTSSCCIRLQQLRSGTFIMKKQIHVMNFAIV